MRAATVEPASPAQNLTERQAQVLAEIVKYQDATGEECSAAFVARRLNLNPETVRRDHFGALYRKGWLAHPESPARLLRQPYLSR